MAKIDVNLYYLECQNQYFEMLENLPEFKQLAKDGVISQAEYDAALKDLETVKTNYERISYIVFLLNKPKKKNDKRSAHKEWYDVLKGASKEAILDENYDALADFKLYIKNGKERLDGNID